ncbi:hypothetical protein SDC9_164198 [bioreactor metagenome]|uniref:Uncharacterized protein n=1 Tax=bioreactor metagenome TaxID=1076179 RepID=A0A645FR09_9ZZZZ
MVIGEFAGNCFKALIGFLLNFSIGLVVSGIKRVPLIFIPVNFGATFIGFKQVFF